MRPDEDTKSWGILAIKTKACTVRVVGMGDKKSLLIVTPDQRIRLEKEKKKKREGRSANIK